MKGASRHTPASHEVKRGDTHRNIGAGSIIIVQRRHLVYKDPHKILLLMNGASRRIPSSHDMTQGDTQRDPHTNTVTCGWGLRTCVA